MQEQRNIRRAKCRLEKREISRTIGATNLD